MFKAYSDVLSYPGAKSFCAAAAIARFPMAMESLSLLLMLSAIYSQYTLAGQVNAALTLAFAFANPFLARLADQYGQSKILRPVTVAQLLCLAGLIWAIMTKQSPWILFTLAVLAGLCTGSFGAYARSRWAKVLSSAQRKMNSAFALEAALDEVIFIIGPVLATVLVTTVHPAAGLVCCLVAVLFGAFWFLSQTATEPKPRPRKEYGLEESSSLFKSGAMVVLCLIYMACGLAFGALDLSVVAFCREVEMAYMAGPMVSIVGVGSLFSALVYGSREWPLSPLRLFAGGILVMALAFSSFIASYNLPLLAVSLVLVGLTYAPTMTNTVNLLQMIVPPSRFTEGMAWFNTTFTIGVSLGTWIVGRVIDAYGANGGLMVVVVTGWLMLILVLGCLRVLRNSLRRARARRQVQVDYHLELDRAQERQKNNQSTSQTGKEDETGRTRPAES